MGSRGSDCWVRTFVWNALQSATTWALTGGSRSAADKYWVATAARASSGLGGARVDTSSGCGRAHGKLWNTPPGGCRVAKAQRSTLQAGADAGTSPAAHPPCSPRVKPADCAAVDQRRVGAQPLAQCSPDGAHCQHDVQARAAGIHKVVPQLSRRLSAGLASRRADGLHDLSWRGHIGRGT